MPATIDVKDAAGATQTVNTLPALGQAVEAASLPVTLASDQALPLPSGAATSAKQDAEAVLVGAINETAPATDTASSGLNGRLQRIAQRLTSLIALLPTSLGAGGGLKVDGSGTALPVSGSVTANAGTNLNTSALALDATLGTTNTEIGGLTETAPATDTASSGLNGRLQRIAQRLTSILAVLPAALSAGGNLKVVINESGTATPVTASAGTNLNTSALALEAGGNLAAAAASLSVLDDWDETDRAKVNPIVGQAGVSAGAGVTDAATIRVITASDGPLNAVLGTTAGATVITDANGTLQQYLRGIVKLLITSGTIILGAGTNGIGKLTANSGVTIGAVELAAAQTLATLTTLTGGGVASDGVDSGNPVKIGARAVAAEITAVSAADRVDLLTDLVGKLLVLPYANPENFLNGTTAAITDTTSTAVIAAQSGSNRIYVTSIIVTNSHASVGTFVKILDGSTIIWEGYAAPAGGGFAHSFTVPLRGTAATALNAQAVTTGANFIVSAAGYKGV